MFPKPSFTVLGNPWQALVVMVSPSTTRVASYTGCMWSSSAGMAKRYTVGAALIPGSVAWPISGGWCCRCQT